jgi:outer membrane lipoprotein
MQKFCCYSIAFLLSSLILSCANTRLYQRWEDRLDETVAFSQIIQAPQKYKGKMVYWGGTIINTLNTALGTQIEVIQKALDSRKFPRKTDQSGGRFIAVYPRHLDPAIYAPQRDIVIVGKISGTKSKTLGETEYHYPLIAAEDVQLIEQKAVESKPSLGIGIGVGGVGIGL